MFSVIFPGQGSQIVGMGKEFFEKYDLVKNLFKLFMNKNGIQNSVFYGEDAFFIPNHQSLNPLGIQFIFEVVCFYLKNDNL